MGLRCGDAPEAALANRGDRDNVMLARRVDSLNDGAASVVSTVDDLLTLAGDMEASRKLHRIWQGVTAQLLTISGECIDASIPTTARVPA